MVTLSPRLEQQVRLIFGVIVSVLAGCASTHASRQGAPTRPESVLCHCAVACSRPGRVVLGADPRDAEVSWSVDGQVLNPNHSGSGEGGDAQRRGAASALAQAHPLADGWHELRAVLPVENIEVGRAIHVARNCTHSARAAVTASGTSRKKLALELSFICDDAFALLGSIPVPAPVLPPPTVWTAAFKPVSLINQQVQEIVRLEGHLRLVAGAAKRGRDIIMLIMLNDKLQRLNRLKATLISKARELQVTRDISLLVAARAVTQQARKLMIEAQQGLAIDCACGVWSRARGTLVRLGISHEPSAGLPPGSTTYFMDGHRILAIPSQMGIAAGAARGAAGSAAEPHARLQTGFVSAGEHELSVVFERPNTIPVRARYRFAIAHRRPLQIRVLMSSGPTGAVHVRFTESTLCLAGGSPQSLERRGGGPVRSPRGRRRPASQSSIPSP